MNDSFARLWTAVRAVAATAAMMTVLVTTIAFVLETTFHDWYATGKVTLVEAMIATGFDPAAWTEYWTADGRTVRRSRYGLTISEAWVVRRRLLLMAADRALLGACTGLVVGFLWLRAPKAARPPRPGRSGVFARPAQLAERGGGINPAGDPRTVRSEARGPARPEEALPATRVPALPPAAAATRPSADHPSGSKRQRPTGSEAAGKRRAETVTGKKSPVASTGLERRKRDYGRWI